MADAHRAICQALAGALGVGNSAVKVLHGGGERQKTPCITRPAWSQDWKRRAHDRDPD